jgi:hypothetical protein
MEIKRLILDFPHGATPGQCQAIANAAQEHVNANVSEGGMLVEYMPMTAEEEKHRGMEFSKDVGHYVFGHIKKPVPELEALFERGEG